MKRASNVCIALAAVLVIIGGIFFYKGFDKKNHYYNNTTDTSQNSNVYVGGDAYNYIINSQYFVGYITIGSMAFVCGSIFACLGISLHYKKENSSNVETKHNDTPESRSLPPLE
jgi:hypothetical protein